MREATTRRRSNYDCPCVSKRTYTRVIWFDQTKRIMCAPDKFYGRQVANVQRYDLRLDFLSKVCVFSAKSNFRRLILVRIMIVKIKDVIKYVRYVLWHVNRCAILWKQSVYKNYHTNRNVCGNCYFNKKVVNLLVIGLYSKYLLNFEASWLNSAYIGCHVYHKIYRKICLKLYNY